MTKLQIYECIKNHFSITSSEMIYDSGNNINIPRYSIVEVVDEGEKLYHYFHYNKDKMTFSMRTFTSEESLYINHLMYNRLELLQNKLNSGMLYNDVLRLVRNARKAVNRQANIWAEKDEDIHLALRNNDQTKYRKLLAGLESAAQEEIYPAMLYV